MTTEHSTTVNSNTRRRILRSLGVGFLGGGLAGCSSSDGDPTSTGTNGAPTTTAPATDTPGSTAVTPTEERGTAEPTDDGSDETESGPRSASRLDLADGFADPAPWLDDSAEVAVVDEPTRSALEGAINAGGPRVVVFETSGTIDLEGERLTARAPCWIAGQTAPSPGVTLTRGALWIDADDSVVQHLRVRPGDAGFETEDGWEPDTIRTDDGTSNVVIDHCSATWSVDENVSPGYESTDTTVSNCIIAEALDEATHHKGAHAYGSLVGDGATNVAMMGNVFAHNTARNPRLKARTESVVVNNVMYHFDEAVTLDDSTIATVEGNAFLRVDEGDANVEGGVAHVADNVSEPDTEMSREVDHPGMRPLWSPDIDPLPGSEVEAHNLANAGARPADRSDHDERVLQQVADRSGGTIDSQEEVGGYPELAENTHELDVPDTGLRTWLREQALAVEQ